LIKLLTGEPTEVFFSEILLEYIPQRQQHRTALGRFRDAGINLKVHF